MSVIRIVSKETKKSRRISKNRACGTQKSVVVQDNLKNKLVLPHQLCVEVFQHEEARLFRVTDSVFAGLVVITLDKSCYT